jgi:HlyD family secretion protein
MTTDIFRKVALERLSTPEQLDQVLALSPSGNRIAIHVTFVVLLLILLASFIISVPIMAKGVGIVLAADGMAEVSAPHGGRVSRVLVKPGDRIAAGAAIIELSQPDLENTLRTLHAERADLARQRQHILRLHGKDDQVQGRQRKQHLRELEQRRASTQQRLAWMEDRLKQDDALVAQGFLSRNKLQDTRTEFLQTQDRLAETDSQLRALEVEETNSQHGRQRETLDIDLRLASIEHKVGELTAKLERESVATSPHEGVIVEVKIARGDIIGAGNPLLAVLTPAATRAGEQAVLAYLPPGEAKKVQPLMGARVTPSNYKKEEYGSIIGRVTGVSTVPATAEGMQRALRNRQLVQSLSQQVPPIEIRIALDADSSSPSGLRWTSRGPDQKLDVGTTVEVEIVVKRMRLIVLALPALERWLSIEPAQAADTID